MTQYQLPTIDANTNTGADLATFLNSWNPAVVSNHSGTSRPSYALPGTLWVYTGTINEVSLNFYDGVQDVLLYTIDVTTGNITFGGGDSGLTYQGPINPTINAPIASSGDMYVADTAGTIHASFTGISGLSVSVGDTLIYNGSEWDQIDNSLSLSGYLPLSGGTMTGQLTLDGDAVSPLDPVTLQQLESATSFDLNDYLLKAGGTMTGQLILSGDAVDDLEAVTKQQLDAAAGGVSDHGGLTGLTDDDHTQYHTDARGDARYYTQAQVDALTWAADDIASGTFADARISESSVTQHQAALSITESQISDLGSYLTAETNDLTAAVTWANVPDINITESSVTQHEAALSITESQISDLGTYLTDITGQSITALSDVFTSMTPSDGDVLTYDTTNGWQAEAPSGGGGTPTLIEDGTSKVEIESTNGPIVGTVAGTELFRYTAAGLVVEGAVEANDDITITTAASHAYLRIITDDTYNSGVLFGDVSDNVVAGVIYNNSTDVFELRSSDNTAFLSADANQDVSIPNGDLSVSGRLALVDATISPAHLINATTSGEALINLQSSDDSGSGILLSNTGSANRRLFCEGGEIKFQDNGGTTDDLVSKANGDLEVRGAIDCAGLIVADNTISMTDTDVNHGITTLAPTATYYLAKILDGVNGGFYSLGISEVGVGYEIEGVSTTESPSDTGNAPIVLNAGLKSGTGTTAISAGNNLFALQNNGSTVEVTKDNGDKVLQGGLATGGADGSNVATGGIDINLGTSAGRIIAVTKTDLAHGMTSLSPTDRASSIKNLAAEGGIEIDSYSSGATAAAINPTSTTPNTDDTFGVSYQNIRKKSGTTAAALDATDLAWTLHSGSSTSFFRIRGTGNVETDGSLATGGADLTYADTGGISQYIDDGPGSGLAVSSYVEGDTVATGITSDPFGVTVTAKTAYSMGFADNGFGGCYLFGYSVNVPGVQLIGTADTTVAPGIAINARHNASGTIGNIADDDKAITFSQNTGELMALFGNGDVDIKGEVVTIGTENKRLYPDAVDYNAQTGTSYTAVLSDAEQVISMDNGSANTLTIPANSSVAYPVGTKLHFLQLGAGQTTIAINTDTLNVESTFTLKLAGQYAMATALKVTATSWVLFGNLEAV